MVHLLWLGGVPKGKSSGKRREAFCQVETLMEGNTGDGRFSGSGGRAAASVVKAQAIKMVYVS
jgi:hypothetical protein